MRRILTCVLGLAAASAPRAADPTPEVLDLPAAIRMAYERNRELARQGRKIEQAVLDTDSARAEFAVRLRPASGFRQTPDGPDWTLGTSLAKKTATGAEVAAGGLTESLPDDWSEDYRSSVELSISQPLFRRFGALVQMEPVRLAESARAAVQRRFEELKAGLVVQLVVLFEDIRLLEEQIRSDERLRDRADRLKRLTQVRERTGRVTRVDTLRAEGLSGEAEARLTATRERLESRRRELAELLGAPMSRRWVLQPPPRVDVAGLDPDAAVATALGNRLDLAQALADAADRERGADIARRQRAPDLNLAARYRRFGEDDGYSVDERLENEDWFVGVGFYSDLNFKRDRLAYERALSSRAESRETVEIVCWSIARDVLQRVSDYRRARAELPIAGRNVAVAAGRATLARRLFDGGRGDPFSVSDAEEALSLAEIRLRQVQADACVSGYRLLHGMGTLTDVPPELRPAAPPGGSAPDTSRFGLKK